MALSSAKFRALSQLAQALGRTAASRRARGPKRPGWSFRYEAISELLRSQFGGAGMNSVATFRKQMDAAGRLEDKRNRADFSEVSVDGMSGVWVSPRWREAKNVVLYLHGGGYIAGSTMSHRGVMASVAVFGGVRVLGVDYRLTPDHPCPAAVEDALKAYRWLLERYEASEIVVAGDSAGGGLTAALLLALKEEGITMPAGAVLLSPWTDLRTSAFEGKEDRGFDYIQPHNLDDTAGAYGDELGREHPFVSPVLADLSGLPSLLVLTGGLEFLVEDNAAFVTAARAAGVDVQHHVEPDELHVYPAFFDLSPGAAAGLGHIASFLQRCWD